jgi:sorbose reductase
MLHRRVTGGAGTLGFAASRALLEHGLSGLMIFDINPTQAQPKIDELHKGKRSKKMIQPGSKTDCLNGC